ncbi:glycoside hydrolase family 30 protein [Mucilaginibacter agri]|uniref:Glucosylceramidase n=1 Tax=Mucilaginibacter agri TaxID=2695265 RepID=A0A965ZLD9_9SPHI|nr:glycoside hydrolase family 30 beta sandwich domain-containing protein [Mucilaginibacter agri]NCD72148.1 glucosylceramidase [Mucilaginibacter agri]
MVNIKQLAFTAVMAASVAAASAQQKGSVQTWLTNADQSALFQRQNQETPFSKNTNSNPVIEINEKESYQSIDGFGFCLTGGSAQLIMKMDAAKRAELLKDLFATDGTNIGISYLRVTIGASDLNEYVFSYDDLPKGETDVNMTKFDLGPDEKDVIPVLKEILTINPKIKILGSSWSPPVWMKTTGDTKGGSLKPEYFDAYAKYLVKYVKAMKQNGITIDAMTVQNEPLHGGNNPSMVMPALDEANFIKTNLGPMFKAEDIKTKIIIYDHNCDKPEYPISILNDPDAKKYVDGSAFHLYGGKIEALSEVHNAHPDRNLYFTEQWMGAPGDFKRDVTDHITKLTIGATRNWSRTVIEWNLATDQQYGPHTDRGGCDICMGGITINKDSFTRNPAYYVVAHAAKFVRPGSVRIGSNLIDDLPNVAFKTPEGKKVLIVINNGSEAKNFDIKYKDQRVTEALKPGSVATYIWN